MNTFTFTDGELELLIEAIDSTQAYAPHGSDELLPIREKLERKQTTLMSEGTIKANSIQNELASQLLKKRELILKQAIDNHLAGWVLADLEGRLRSEEFGGKLTIYFLDDKPILEMAKVESYISSNGHSVGFNAEETYKFL